jgi:hypothetical protein
MYIEHNTVDYRVPYLKVLFFILIRVVISSSVLVLVS